MTKEELNEAYWAERALMPTKEEIEAAAKKVRLEQDKCLLIEFRDWYDKLSPAEKCTVWPPAGSGPKKILAS
jgi:hypothetical protein